MMLGDLVERAGEFVTEECGLDLIRIGSLFVSCFTAAGFVVVMGSGKLDGLTGAGGFSILAILGLSSGFIILGSGSFLIIKSLMVHGRQRWRRGRVENVQRINKVDWFLYRRRSWLLGYG